MRVLLDTHVLLWWLDGSPRLSAKAKRVLANGDNELLWSAASTWELAIKSQLGKVRLHEPLRGFIPRVIVSQGLTPLSIEHVHAAYVAELPIHHRDPFDRLLVAQAIVEGVPLMTGDEHIAEYDVELVPV
jgi:PIN domain nuclease of toxin-antitoxin system